MILKNLTNLQQRLTISSIGVAFLVIAIYLSMQSAFRPIFALLLATCAGFSLWEYYQIAKAKKFMPLVTLAIGCSTLYVAAIFLVTQDYATPLLPQIVAALSLLTFSTYYIFKDTNPLANLAITVFGLIYLTIPLSLLLIINYFFDGTGAQDGRLWLFYLLTVTKITDAGAYFTGSKLGARKLAPRISPKKTIEGAIGGLLASVIMSLIFYWASYSHPDTFHMKISLTESLILGVAIGIIGQVGDLIESLLKRDGGIKDSNQLPGLGGMLDIVDSLIFTTPLVYFFLKLKG